MADGDTSSSPTFNSRQHQMFPVLTREEIERISRFGTRKHYERGSCLFAAGERGPGMFVVLQGNVCITQRDGLGHVVPIVKQGPGQFLAEVGQLSGRPALVDGEALDDVEVLLVPPQQLRALIIAEADLGERIIRALILRRVALIEAGASGAVLIGRPQSAALLALQNFLRRNGMPHHVLDATHDVDARALVEQYGAAVGDVLAVCPDGSVLQNPTETTLGRCLGMLDTSEREELFDVAIVGAGPAGSRDRGVRRLRRPQRRRARLPRLWRTGGCERAHRELPGLPDRHLGRGARRPRVRAGPEVRRRDHDSRAGRRPRLHARRERRRARPDVERRPTPARAHRGDRQRRALPAAGGAAPARVRGTRRLVLGLGDRGAAVREVGGRARRRRQFGRAGGGVPRAARRPGRGPGARTRTRSVACRAT